MKRHHFKILIALLLACLANLAFAGEPKLKPGAENETPKELSDIGITEHLGEKIDLNLKFVDETGKQVLLGDFFKSGKPVLLDLAYYGCPGLCNYHLNGFSEGLKKLSLTPGKDYEWVVVSFDSNEKPALAQSKKKNMQAAFGRVEASQGWHFLTGDKAQIDALAKQVGFTYKWVPEEKQFAHASAAYVITPEAKISRYLKGIEFDPQTIKLSVLEARGGGVSSIVDTLILYCFHYDAKASKYSLALMNIVRIAGALTAFLLLIVVLPNVVRNRKI